MIESFTCILYCILTDHSTGNIKPNSFFVQKIFISKKKVDLMSDLRNLNVTGRERKMTSFENTRRRKRPMQYHGCKQNKRKYEWTSKYESYRFKKLLLSIFLDRSNEASKTSHLEMHIYCKITIPIGLSIHMIGRTSQIFVSNCTWSHINTGI